MKLIKNRLRFCEAFKAMLEQPHKIRIKLPTWDGMVLMLERKVSLKGTKDRIYFDLLPNERVKLDGVELLSENWETYEI